MKAIHLIIILVTFSTYTFSQNRYIEVISSDKILINPEKIDVKIYKLNVPKYAQENEKIDSFKVQDLLEDFEWTYIQETPKTQNSVFNIESIFYVKR